MHDVYEHTVRELVPWIIRHRPLGYKFVTVAECLGDKYSMYRSNDINTNEDIDNPINTFNNTDNNNNINRFNNNTVINDDNQGNLVYQSSALSSYKYNNVLLLIIIVTLLKIIYI